MSATEPEPAQFTHLSPLLTNKDDDDPILEFKNIDTGSLEVKKAKLINIPFFPATGSELVAHTLHKIEAMRDKSKSRVQSGARIVLPFDPYRFIWVRMRKKMLELANRSFINLPDGSGILWMSRKLRHAIPELVTTINYTMNLIRLAHAKEYTVFLVGSKDETLEKLFTNLRRSFPGLRIVGRHHGYLKGENRKRVIEALRKTDPHIILLGMGYHKGMHWLLEFESQLGNTIIVNTGGAFDTLAGVKKKAPDYLATRGYVWLWRTINRPWRWHRFLLVLYWYFEVLWHRLFKVARTER